LYRVFGRFPVRSRVDNKHRTILATKDLCREYRCRSRVDAFSRRRQVQHIKVINLLKRKQTRAVFA
jgi:hypothetical protein